MPRIVSIHVIFDFFDSKMVSSTQNWILMGVCEVRFFDRTNGLAARTKKRIAPKPLVLSKKCTSMTQVKIQFCLLGTIFTTKFAKIKDREIAPFEHWFEFCRLFNKRFRECKQTLSVLDEVRVRWSCDKTNSTKLF